MIDLPIELLLIPTLLLIFGFGLRVVIGSTITWEVGYLSGAIIAMILTSTIGTLHNNKEKFNRLFRNYKSIFTTTALILAFLGAGVWMIGEYWQWIGYEKNMPFLDPLGASAMFLSGSLSLVVHFS